MPERTSALPALLWFFWLGLFAVTLGEVVLFAASGGGSGASTAGGPPLPQILVTASVATVLFSLSIAAHYFRIGGDGLPTGIISWVLAKSVAIVGLVFYKLAGDITWLWPFLAGFAVAMLVARPTTLMGADRADPTDG